MNDLEERAGLIADILGGSLGKDAGAALEPAENEDITAEQLKQAAQEWLESLEQELNAELGESEEMETLEAPSVEKVLGYYRTKGDPNSIRVGDTVQILGKPNKVIDFGSWQEMKSRYPTAAQHAIDNSTVPESRFGRTWAVQDGNGKVWLLGSQAIRLFVKGMPSHCMKDQGQPCQQGETSAQTGCVPQSGGSAAQPAAQAAPAPKPSCPVPPCNRPSQKHERKPGQKPAAQVWKDPPAKKGKTGGGQIQRPKGDQSQTKIGDLGEELAVKLGFRNILPEGHRHFTAAQVAALGSSIDLEFGHSGRVYELKLCNTTSTEYRLKAKAEEKEAKLKYAKGIDAEVYTLIGVRDVETGEIYFYASKDPGLTGAEVSDKKFDFLGSVKP